ncbi:MAG: sensor domain-containing diguanylate cyclase [Firmicutes bacterium]|nr:sensor domain-containing diguanylate cyclase [Bacillota bacterium]
MNIVIISGDKGDSSVLQTIAEASSLNILAIIAESDDKESIELAKYLDIPIEYDYCKLLERTDIDMIIDLSGSNKLIDKIRKVKPERAEIIDKSTANIISRLLESEGRATYDLIDRLTREHWSLYEIGISLSSAKGLPEVCRTIVQHAMKLTNTPAGSLAVYDEKSGEMLLATTLGFSGDMSTQKRWKLRPGGLTNYILNQKGPVIIPDIHKYPEFNTAKLVNEGIRSLIACPLFLENIIVGILYVDDFKVREFSSKDISILCLFSTYAALAIEKAKLLEETKLLAITDDLTKLYNHRHFNQRLETEFSRAKRYNEPLSLIIIDIDHFKNYNDINGHVKGNDVLKQLADILRRICRDSDIIARYGGEEFTVICPKSDRANAYHIADRLRKNVEEHKFPNAQTQPEGRITISAGVACFPEDAADVGELIEKADTALYLAKRRGRNRVCTYPGLKQETM